MYRTMRNTHLLIGLFCCLYLLMYGVSAIQMGHGKWFSSRPQVTQLQFTLAPGATDARVVGRELIDRHGLRGEMQNVRAGQDRLSFWIVRPGTVYEVGYTPATGDTAVRDNHAGLIGMLNRLHHVGGVWHEYWLVNVWGIFTGVVSACLFFMGATGIYLWFKLHEERVIGTVLLVVSLAYSLSLLVMVRAAW